MPVHSRVSVRYARALVMAAQSTDGIASLREESAALAALIRQTPALAAFLDDPSVNKHDKARVLDVLIGEKLSPLMKRFVGMLVDKYRERLLVDILDAAAGLIDEREGSIKGEVISAVPLSDGQRDSLRGALEHITGKKVALLAKEEPELVAGFVVRVGDTVYDGSLEAQLSQMRDRLMQGNLRAAVHTP